MKIMDVILNNEEKEEMVEALKESEALNTLYYDKVEEIKAVLDFLVGIKKRNKKVFIAIYEINPSDYEDYTLKLAEDAIKTFINKYIKDMDKKPSDAVVMYFIKIFTALFYLYFDNSYLEKMRTF